MKKLLVITTSLLILNTNSAQACSCLPTTPKQSLEGSSAVFSGRVIDVVEQTSDRAESSNSLDSGFKVTFEVSKVWKGKNERRVAVMTSDSSASCGYSFEEGKEYLVYASNQEAKLQTGLCSGTKLLSEAQPDLAVLGRGESPIASSSPAQSQLQQNRQLWRTQNISNYRYTLQVGCFCLPEVTQPVVIEVRNGKVVSMIGVNTRKPVNPEYFKDYNSIPKLFNLVQNAIANRAHRISVTYHPTRGYPTQISIDQSQQMADEERYFTIERLEVIR